MYKMTRSSDNNANSNSNCSSSSSLEDNNNNNNNNNSSKNNSDLFFGREFGKTTLNAKQCKKVVKHTAMKLNELETALKEHCPAQVREIPTLLHKDVILGKMLGHGSFSAVYDIQNESKSNESNESKTVVKMLRRELIERPGMFAACVSDIYKEATILSHLQHDNIIGLHATSQTTFEDFQTGRCDAFFLVLGKLRCTLHTTVKTDWKVRCAKKTWKESKQQIHRRHAMFIQEQMDAAVQLAAAIEYLHANNILHRDLKPDNVGFDAHSNTLKLFDFDVARVLPSNRFDQTFLLTQKVGTKRYMAPEVINGPYNIAADVYSYSLLLYYILSLQRPYDEFPQADDVLQAAYEKGVRPNINSITLSNFCPDSIKEVMEQAWSATVTERPSMKCIHDLLQQEQHRMQQEFDKSHQKKKIKLHLPKLFLSGFSKKKSSTKSRRQDNGTDRLHDNNQDVVAPVKTSPTLETTDKLFDNKHVTSPNFVQQ